MEDNNVKAEKLPYKLRRHYYFYKDMKRQLLIIQFKTPDGIAKKFTASYKNKHIGSVRSALIQKYREFVPYKRERKKKTPVKSEFIPDIGKDKKSSSQKKKKISSEKKEKVEIEVKKKETPKKVPEKQETKPLDLTIVERIDDLPIKEYFKEPKTLGIIGVGRSGKTKAISRMFCQCLTDLFDCITLTTGTLEGDAYKEMKKDKNLVCMNEVNEDYMKAQYTLAKETKGKWYKFLNIYDDINPDNRFTHMIQRAITKHRNLGVSSIFSIQSKTFLTPTSRQNLHGIIIMNAKKLEKGYLETFAEVVRPYFDWGVKKDDIIGWLIENTRNFQFIFVDSFNDKIYLCRNKID